MRGGIVDLFPATEERAVRIELFDIEVESLRWFSTFTQRSLGTRTRSRSRRPPSSRPSTATSTTSSTCRSTDFRELLDLIPEDAQIIVAAEEDLEPSLRDNWQDVCAAFHDEEAGHLYVKPERVLETLDRARADPPRRPRRRPGVRVPRPGRRHRRALARRRRARAREAHPLAVHDRRRLGQPRHRRARRLQPRPAEGPVGRTTGAAALRRGAPARRLHRPAVPARGHPRPPARPRPPAAPGEAAGPGGGRGALRSFADLRTGDIVVHEDHGLARFAGFDTKTVAGVTRDYLNLEYAGTDKVFLPVDQLAKISRYVSGGGAHPPLSKLGGTRWETIKSRARRAAQELAGELLNLYAERRRRRGHAFAAGPRGAARARGQLALPRDARPARGDRARQGRHGVRPPDGPADLRRRRLRQDRGRAARRGQGDGGGASRC